VLRSAKYSARCVLNKRLFVVTNLLEYYLYKKVAQLSYKDDPGQLQHYEPQQQLLLNSQNSVRVNSRVFYASKVVTIEKDVLYCCGASKNGAGVTREGSLALLK
jgi:hypothetical protein